MANSSSYIDLTNEHAGDAADGIVNIINAMAKAKQSQTDLQKEIMLDQIGRSRNQQDAKAKLEAEAAVKQEENQKQMASFKDMFDPSGSTPQGNPSTNSSGMANGATAAQIGTNPSSPVSPVGGAMPPGYSPPMSMADPSQQPANDAMQTPQGAPAPVPAQGPTQPQQLPPAVKTQLEQEMGFVPTQIPQFKPEMGPNGPRLVYNDNYVGVGKPYNEALKKNAQGLPLSPGELEMVKNNTAGYQNAEKQKSMENDKLQKNLIDMGKQIDPSEYRSGAFGDAKKVFDRGARLSSLMDAAVQFQQGGADSRQIQELAIGLNSMLAGNNVSAVEQVKGLVPHSAIGNGTKLAEWLTNQPLGLNQQKFVERMMNTVNNEMATTKAQMDLTRFQRLTNYYGVEKNHPEEFNAVLRGHGINPDDYQAWKASGSPAFSAIQKKQAGPGGTKNDGNKGPSIGTVDGGYKFKGGDPSKQSSWEKV